MAFCVGILPQFTFTLNLKTALSQEVTTESDCRKGFCFAADLITGFREDRLNKHYLIFPPESTCLEGIHWIYFSYILHSVAYRMPTCVSPLKTMGFPVPAQRQNLSCWIFVTVIICKQELNQLAFQFPCWIWACRKSLHSNVDILIWRFQENNIYRTPKTSA